MTSTAVFVQVRTARVILATSDPNKAVEEVAHELMHAAQVGLTWPDECFIGRALQSEVGENTATVSFSALGRL